jgi:hypothetical protein
MRGETIALGVIAVSIAAALGGARWAVIMLLGWFLGGWLGVLLVSVAYALWKLIEWARARRPNGERGEEAASSESS